VESEAFRTLRTTLAFSGGEMQRLAVTSSEPGDGKTTVLSNLGASFAQAGKRTLLIDADMRRPGLSKLFSLRGRNGLSDVLRGSTDIATMCGERIQETGVPGLFLLPCGPKPADPAELLSGPRMADLVAWAETHFDQVLIDCPPMLAASDAALVGRLTDGVVLVVQPEKNHRRLVLRAVEGLRALQVTLVGVVANNVNGAGEEGYYGYGAGYGYGYGYGESDDEQFESDQDAGDEIEQPARRAA
jgi:capsular exopolysaccharide synthesis family protein